MCDICFFSLSKVLHLMHYFVRMLLTVLGLLPHMRARMHLSAGQGSFVLWSSDAEVLSLLGIMLRLMLEVLLCWLQCSLMLMSECCVWLRELLSVESSSPGIDEVLLYFSRRYIFCSFGGFVCSCFV